MRQISIYGLISVLCLGIDIALLSMLVGLYTINPTLAGTASYIIGLCVHYALSIRFVFAEDNPNTKPNHLAHFLGYVVTGVIGTSITGLIIYLGEMIGLALLYSKSVAIIVSFFAVFYLRKYFVFRKML